MGMPANNGKVVARWVGYYLNLPWKLEGMNRDGLCDWGLVRLIFSEQYGLAMPSHLNIPNFDDAVAEHILSTFIPLTDPVIGSVVIAPGNTFGMVCGNENFITVEKGRKSCLMLLDPSLRYFEYTRFGLKY